jgi:hypothetical protein
MNTIHSAAAMALLAIACTGAQAMGRLADLTITDRTTGRVLPTYWHEGQAWVAGTPGHEYSVAVRNRRGEDLLAVVSVDGVNVIDGETARPSQAGYIVAPHGRIEVKGWRKSMADIASFYFTSLGDSYAARTGRPDDVGVIGIALFERARALPPPVVEAAPAERLGDARRESNMARDKSLSSPSAPPATAQSPAPLGEPLGTGHGRREGAPVRFVEFERATTQPVETLVIRYDSYANLVAMGVIPTYGVRTPRAFPGAFVPDPR